MAADPTDARPRFRAALFASSTIDGRDERDRLTTRLTTLRSVAQARGYDVVTEHTDNEPPWKAHEWVYAIIEGADAGTFHALFVESVRQLGPSTRHVNWIRGRLERGGAWIVETRPTLPQQPKALEALVPRTT